MVSVFRKSLDFLDVRLTSGSEKLQPLFHLVDNSHIFTLDNGFYVILSYDTNTRKILWLRDRYHVDVAYISLLVNKGKKGSEGSYMQFVGHFWTMYSDYLDYFLDMFDVNPDALGRVRRFDYCFDMYISTGEFRKNLFSQKGHITEYSYEGEYSGLKIVMGDSKDSVTHEIGLYDKKLDTLRKGKYKWDIPENPYSKQLKHEGYISRLECRFFSRATRRFKENGKKNDSVNRILRDAETLASDYLKKWFVLPFDFERTYNKRDSKPDERIQKLSRKKLNFYKGQAFAYMDNIRLLDSEHELFEWIRKTFPSIDDYIICTMVQKGRDSGLRCPPIDNRGTLMNKKALQKQIFFQKGRDIHYLIFVTKDLYREKIKSLGIALS